MRKIAMGQVRPGMVVAKTIFNERGDSLLRAGVSLTADYIHFLGNRGFPSIYVRDSPEDEYIPDDIVTERVRQRAFKQLQSVYDLSIAANQTFTEVPQEHWAEVIADGVFPGVAQNPRLFDGLVDSVDALIRDVLSAPLLFNLNALRTHDTYTFYHSVDMTIVAITIGKKLSLSVNNLRQLAIGCMVHDIGKLFIPAVVLNKPGKLDDEEWKLIRQHPHLGYEFLQKTGLNSIDLLPKHVALQHHERQDGHGYPRGLVGTNETRFRSVLPPGHMLPIAEIAAVADVYDALRADRPYRVAFPPEKVIAMLRDMAGDHLNHKIVDALLSVVPVYPPGTPIVVRSGNYKDFRGVVVETLPGALERPRIRLLEDPDGKRVHPIKIDLTEDQAVEITTAVPVG